MTENEIENRGLLINKWFHNLLVGNLNEEILLLHTNDVKVASKIISILEKVNVLRNHYSIYFQKDFQSNHKKMKNSKNIILVVLTQNEILSILSLRAKLKKSFLFIPSTCKFYGNPEHYISYMTRDSSIIKQNRYLYYIEEINPYALIKSEIDVEIKNFIIFIVQEGILSWYTLENISLLIGNTTYSNRDYISEIDGDIKMLNSSNILTARLAIVVYRIATLDLTATSTKIGRYFHEESGSKSKTFNIKNNKIVTITHDLLNKSFKAYDLSVNEAEIAIRMDIARNLISLNIDDLDAEIIAKATNLPIKNVAILS